MISLTYSTYEFCQIIMTVGLGRGHRESRGKSLQRITTLELEMDPKGHLIQPPIGCQIPSTVVLTSGLLNFSGNKGDTS